MRKSGELSGFQSSNDGVTAGDGEEDTGPHLSNLYIDVEDDDGHMKNETGTVDSFDNITLL
jgi:hypothetical protein